MAKETRPELCRFRDGFSYPPADFDLVTCAWCYNYAGSDWFPPGGKLQLGEHWYRRDDGTDAVTYVSFAGQLQAFLSSSNVVGQVR